MQRGELAGVLAVFLHLRKLLAHHLAEQFLGFDERHLHIAVRVAVQRELACHALRQALEGGGVILAQV